MKRLLILIAIPCVLLCAADTKKKKATTPPPAPKSSTAAELTVPAGATQVEPYLYRYQDPSGKKWLYRQTPFGVVKMEDKPAAAAPVVDTSTPVLVKDLGDSVRFEKKTPFGVQSWTRKKTDLSEEEKGMIESDKTGTSPRPAITAKPAEKN